MFWFDCRISNHEPGGYYLLGELATAQLRLERAVRDTLTQCGYVKFFCPDMVRKLVVEGCGKHTADPSQVSSIQFCHSLQVDLTYTCSRHFEIIIQLITL